MNPKTPTCCDCNLQIPSNAEVKAIPFNALPLKVLQKFRQMDSYINGKDTPYVIFVSPVTKSTFWMNHKMTQYGENFIKPTFCEHNHKNFMTDTDEQTEDCLVPIKSSVKIASSILQLSRTNKNKTTLTIDESLLPKFKDGLLFNLRVVEMKAKALYKYRNAIYLLPVQKNNYLVDQDVPKAMDTFTPGKVQDQVNNMALNVLRSADIIHPYRELLLSSAKMKTLTDTLLVPQQSVKEENPDDNIQLSRLKPNQPHQGNLQPDQPSSLMEQIKRKIYWQDTEAVKKKSAGGSDTSHEKQIATIPCNSSINMPTSTLQSSLCVPEYIPGISCYSSEISHSDKRSKGTENLISQQMLHMEPPIFQPPSNNDGCSSLDSKSSLPFSMETISTNSSESFESDGNEIQWFNDSPSPEVKRRNDQSSLHKQDETTQDELTQRLQQRMKELEMVVENMRAKNKYSS